MTSALPVVIAAGSNLGDRARYLREALYRLRSLVRVVKISSLYETDPVDAPEDSPPFLNIVVVGLAALGPEPLLDSLMAIESAMGRRRREKNGPRPIDLDLIFFGARLIRSPKLTLPHPRYRTREFVLAPLRELGLRWPDPETGAPHGNRHGEGRVLRIGRLMTAATTFQSRR